MSGLRYYLDEDVVHGPVVATELRKRGVDAITAVEMGRAGQGIVALTRNVVGSGGRTCWHCLAERRSAETVIRENCA